VPNEDLADLDEPAQVEIITQTDNGLKPADPKVQPPQDPNWRPDPDEVEESLI
jgi:hypothetical protein